MSSAVSALRADSFSTAASPDGVQRRLRGAPNRPSLLGLADDEGRSRPQERRIRPRRQHQQACGATKRLDGPGAASQHNGSGSPARGLPGKRRCRTWRSRCSVGRCVHVLLGDRDTRCPAPFRSEPRQGTPTTRVPVIPSRLQHGVLRPPTRRGQSRLAAAPGETGGHDFARPRAWWCPDRVTPPARWPASG